MPGAKKKAKKVPIRRPKKCYDEEDFQKALVDIREGRLSVRKAAILHDVPRSSLQDTLNEKHPKKDGGPTVLSDAEEKRIVAMMLLMSEWGFPWTSSDLCHFVKSYLDKRGRITRFKDNMPTHRFMSPYLKYKYQYLHCQKFKWFNCFDLKKF